MKTRLALVLLNMSPALPAVEYVASDYGGSPVPIGAGARALGMGGAFTAIADDATANTWNPAGMTQLDRPEAAISSGYYRNRTDAADANATTDEEIDLDHVSYVQPFFAGNFQQTAGLAWQRQFDFTRKFNTTTADVQDTGLLFERDDQEALDQDGSYASLSASYAIEAHPGLSLGATANTWDDDWTLESSYSKHTTWDSHTTLSIGPIVLLDVLSHGSENREVTIQEGYSFVLGAWWQANQSLTFGLSVKPEYELRLKTRVVKDQRDTDLLASTVTDQPTIRFEERSDFIYPTSATLGAAWRHNDLKTICADVTWTHWSAYRVRQGGTYTSPINPHIERSDFDDLFTVRFGYEQVFILSDLVLVGRGGGFWEESPAVSKVDTPSDAEEARATVDNYFGGTLGASLCQRHFIYDIATQLRRGDDVGAGQQAGPDQTVDVLSWIVRFGVTAQF